MTARELVLNFVNQYNKPFDAELIANMTGLDIEEVEPVMVEMIRDKTIKLISDREPIYARSNRFNTNLDKQLRAHWNFDPKAALALLNQIEQGQYTSIRSIAEDFGRSRQWVFVYLEALASAGVIGVNQYGYCVLTKKDVGKVGIRIKRGILKELISHCAELRKQQKQQEDMDAWHLKLEVPEPLEEVMKAFDSKSISYEVPWFQQDPTIKIFSQFFCTELIIWAE
jgi:Mn-dependent DtxR family transcriptional regulator